MTDRKSRYVEARRAAFASGRIDRRSFMASMLAAGVTIPAAMGMADAARAATPNKGGRFRLGMAHGSTTDSLDPATYENGMTTHMAFTYGNNLVEVAPDGSVRPELAEEFEARDGGRVWAFKLRPGVTFHDGKDLTPEDVLATFAHHMGEESKSAAKGLLTSVTDVRAEGNDTVVFELDAPNADFPFVITDYHLIILPSRDGAVDPTAGIGTGPYRMTGFEPGVRFTGTRNPDYFKDGAAHFDEVEILSIIDVTARQNALLNGEVEAADRLDPKTLALLERAPQLRVVEQTGYLHYTFPMRLDTPPFGDFDLRMALKLAVDKRELVDKILLGRGALGNDHPISPTVPYHAAALPQRDYDPDQAAFHYRRSGHEGPIRLSASDAAFSGAVDAAQLVQASAKAAGIDIEIVREPRDGYWSNVWNKKGWCACYWGGRPTCDWMFSAAYVEGTEWNDTAWRNTEAADRFNALVVEARAELDPAKRTDMYFECQRLIHEDGGAIVPMFANYLMGVNTSVRTPEVIAANWENDGHKAIERWWFA